MGRFGDDEDEVEHVGHEFDDGDRDESKLDFETGPGRRKKRKRYDQPDAPEGADLDRRLAAEPFNDLGNARRFEARAGTDFRYVDKIGWTRWDGARWNFETGKSEAFRIGQGVTELIRSREVGAYKQTPPK